VFAYPIDPDAWGRDVEMVRLSDAVDRVGWHEAMTYPETQRWRRLLRSPSGRHD